MEVCHKMRKNFIGIGIVLVLLFLLQSSLFADGMIMSVPSAPRMHSELILEEEQYCLINYHEGNQSMFLNVDFSTEHETDSVWIFPVPSNPENVDINIIDLDFSLRGYEVGYAIR